VAADAPGGRTHAAPSDERATPRRPATLDETGPTAPPRKNGELVFAEVWESRVFGLTMALHEAGGFEWEEFRQRLISEIAAWERREEEWSYYGCWLRAFEDLLAHKGLCRTAAVDGRARALAARPKGHDH
jgi:nitrile hydratase accessory protein